MLDVLMEKIMWFENDAGIEQRLAAGGIMKSVATIVQASKADVLPSLEILLDSYLGEEYFSREIAEPILREAASKKELFVAKDRTGEVLGFYRIVFDGTFLVFAYIHLIAVKTNLRGEGIGTKLLKDAEKRIAQEPGYPFSKKVFLLLGKKNRKAKSYYEKNGYVRVGTIPSLFSEGVDEYLMMKELRKGK
jgi:ribosomal protein S18 acetylase RimI-like enzyme